MAWTEDMGPSKDLSVETVTYPISDPFRISICVPLR